MDCNESDNFPRLSVLIASYNLENYIGECIESVMNQTYPNIEIVVVDDGSTDGTLAILEEYQRKGVIKLYTKSNGGTGSVRNFMLSRLESDFFTFVDGDDVVSPDAFAANMPYFANDSVDIVQYPILFGWQSQREEKHTPAKGFYKDKKEILERYLSQEITFCMCDKIYRRAAFGGLVFKEGIFYEDVDSSAQLLQMCCEIAISDKGLYYYRRTANSNITRVMTFKKMYDYFSVVFSFLNLSQRYNVRSSYLFVYLSRWLRLKDFLVFDSFTKEQKKELVGLTRQISISRYLLVASLLSAKLSLRKFKVLRSLSMGDVGRAIILSNR